MVRSRFHGPAAAFLLLAMSALPVLSAAAPAGASTRPTPAEASAAETAGSSTRADTAYVDVSVATLWTAPDIARDLDAPATGNPVDLRTWTASMTLSDRLWLVGHLETQALYGRRVTVLAESGDWVQVAVAGQPTPRDPRGYPGWLPRTQLTDNQRLARYDGRPFALVTSPTSWLYDDQRLTRRHLELSINTRLPVLRQHGDAIQVATPDDGNEWLSSAEARVYTSDSAVPPPTGADLAATAELFVGLPYLWAGTSAYGFDCSGFTHTVYQRYGITIPRDAQDQFDAGQPVADDQLQAGDLVFYAHDGGTGRVHHVGMYIGDGYEIDAPINSSTVESGVEIVKVADHRYADEYAGARRFLPAQQ